MDNPTRARLREKVVINRLNEVYCKLAPSDIHGVGIFAIKKIPLGTNPFKNSYMAQDSVLVAKNKLKHIECSVMDLLQDYHPSENQSQVISQFPNQPIWTNYLNYSETPNIELLPNGEWSTMRIIAPGEELVENPKQLFNEDGTHKVFQIIPGQYRSLS
tara:strand:+ start:328 stop:804 length:477 start_codon:yes stop_codon:yes gene_type:complete